MIQIPSTAWADSFRKAAGWSDFLKKTMTGTDLFGEARSWMDPFEEVTDWSDLLKRIDGWDGFLSSTRRIVERQKSFTTTMGREFQSRSQRSAMLLGDGFVLNPVQGYGMLGRYDVCPPRRQHLPLGEWRRPLIIPYAAPPLEMASPRSPQPLLFQKKTVYDYVI